MKSRTTARPKTYLWMPAPGRTWDKLRGHDGGSHRGVIPGKAAGRDPESSPRPWIPAPQ